MAPGSLKKHMDISNLQVYFGSDLHFIGKVEYMDTHWTALMEQCPWFTDHLVSGGMSHAMTQWGNSYANGEYAEILDLRRNRTLSPAYYIVAANKTLYDMLVDYFWMDHVCFGYRPNFTEFTQFVIDS